jgi:UPF0042 nucleotide-binding protein
MSDMASGTEMPSRRRRVVLVTGLSGGGKSSVLRALEDLGFEAVDNPPLAMIGALVARSERPLAIGVDARTRGFDSNAVLDTLAGLRTDPDLRAELVYAWADQTALLRRYTETRRRHPLAPQGRVIDGIEQEERLTSLLRDAADLAIDTSELPLADLRHVIERQYGTDSDADGQLGMLVSLVSFGYPLGLPRDADLVFDCRFLRNPHYDPILREKTGLDPEVGAYVEADPDFATFFERTTDLLRLLLPRFVQESKKYATVAIGCTGGRHRSVHMVERLAKVLNNEGWRLHVTHRELGRDGNAEIGITSRPIPRQSGDAETKTAVQAQEA